MDVLAMTGQQASTERNGAAMCSAVPAEAERDLFKRDEGEALVAGAHVQRMEKYGIGVSCATMRACSSDWLARVQRELAMSTPVPSMPTVVAWADARHGPAYAAKARRLAAVTYRARH